MERLRSTRDRIGRAHLDVGAPVDGTARDIAGASLSHQGVVGSLSSLLALHLVGKGGHGEKELIGGTLQHPLAVFETVEDAHPRGDELLQGVGGLDLLTPESGSSDMMRGGTGVSV
jgi:hypothetical protein